MSRFNPLFCTPLLCCLALLCPRARGAGADDAAASAATRAEALKTYKDQVAPFINTYCARCHTGNKQKGGVTFQSALKNPGASSFRTVWKRAAEQVKTHDMPPEEEDK